LEGDRVQLQQVVLNLVMNAIEAMQSAVPRTLSIRSCLSKPNFVHVAIEDTGTGIDPSNHDHIFNPMFTTKARGMGIGLSVCQSIVKSHNGRIWVTRGIEKGSIFQFELPTNVGQGDHIRQHQA
jgi:signal transduction histidine kinase